MKKLFLLSSVLISSLMISCTDAQRGKMLNYGNKFSVEMYSGGKLVRSWISSGKVKSEEGSDGYFFIDSQTGKLVEVSGDVVITNADNSKSEMTITEGINK
jgi:hypothetical protein